jgi:ABC-type glutathione transport system ATPase component
MTRGYGTVVSARDVSVEYRAGRAASRHIAVHGVSFDLFAGEILGVIGDSGSGKSTLAAAIARPATPGRRDARVCGGYLSVFDTDVRRLSPFRRASLATRVGYLAQDASARLNSRLTVAENVTEPLFLRDRRADVRAAGQIAATALDSVHLSLSVLERRPWELSSGQRQRVALARSIILDPELFIADEPIHGVDVMVRHDVLDVIPELRERRGFAAIVVTSDLDVVRRVTRRVAVLHAGSIVAIGPLPKLLASPEHHYVRALARTMTEDAAGRAPRGRPR